MEYQLRPALTSRGSGKAEDLVRTMWIMVATGKFLKPPLTLGYSNVVYKASLSSLAGSLFGTLTTPSAVRCDSCAEPSGFPGLSFWKGMVGGIL